MIKREIFKNIKKWLGKEKILIIKGARQVGKTFILKEIKEDLEEEGKKVVYLLADDLDNLSILKSASNLEMYLNEYHDFKNNYIYLMIDEFQALPQAGVFLKNIFDKYKGRLQLIVSGSSALEINKNSEFLTGRAIHFNVSRINFKEYFDFKEGINTKRYSLLNFKDLQVFYDTFKPKLEMSLDNYLRHGSYPEVLTTDGSSEKEIVLKSIIKTYLEKDVALKFNIKNSDGFNNLIKILSGQIGQMVNNHELVDTTNLSLNTLKKYLEVLVGTYIIDLVTPYFKNIRSEISKMPKVFVLDIGIRNYLLRSYTPNEETMGKVIENFVYTTLKSKYNKEYIHFYRTNTGSEIDFVLEDKENKLTLCEVKYRNKVNLPVVMKNFEKKYENINRKIIITKDLLKKEVNVYYIPATILPFINLD